MLLAGVHTSCLPILLHPHSDGLEVNIHSTYLILSTPEGNIYVLINAVVISYSSASSAFFSPFSYFVKNNTRTCCIPNSMKMLCFCVNLRATQVSEPSLETSWVECRKLEDERETGTPNYYLWMPLSREYEIPPIVKSSQYPSCVWSTSPGLCVQMRGDLTTLILPGNIRSYFAKTAFFRTALCDWCQQPCGVQREAQQTSSLPLWRQQMHVGEIWCTGWEDPSLRTVMKEHRRGRVGRAMLHRNSLSRPSLPTSMKNKGCHRSMHKFGILFIPGHIINSDSEFLMTLKQRHCLMYCLECLQFYVLSECVWFFSFLFFFTVPSCSFRDTWIISLCNLFSILASWKRTV